MQYANDSDKHCINYQAVFLSFKILLILFIKFMFFIATVFAIGFQNVLKR